MQVVIAGGSGQVGTILARHFRTRGDSVCVLSRQPKPAPWLVAHWDGQRRGRWVELVRSADVLINLAGRSVNCRYNARNRQQILDSRVQSTNLLGEVVGALSSPPKVWINASTATIYRHALDRDMDEQTGELGGGEAGAPDTWRFSINVAKAWEQAFFSHSLRHTRQIAIRSAMTFSPDHGGVFDVFSRLVRLGLGGKQGRGDQFVSWIHDLDFTHAIDFLIQHEHLSGVVNVAGPCPLPNRDFLRILRRAWNIPIGIPAPRIALELGALLLQTETELILKSRRVTPTLLKENGFVFQFPNWPEAAADLVARSRAGQSQRAEMIQKGRIAQVSR